MVHGVVVGNEKLYMYHISIEDGWAWMIGPHLCRRRIFQMPGGSFPSWLTCDDEGGEGVITQYGSVLYISYYYPVSMGSSSLLLALIRTRMHACGGSQKAASRQSSIQALH